MKHLPVLFGFHASNLGNSHVPLSLCFWWNAMQLPVRLYVPSLDKLSHHAWVVPAVEGFRKNLMYRFGSKTTPQKAVVSLFEKREQAADIVYLWAGLPLEVFLFFQDQGTEIVIERINCHRGSAQKILRMAYEREELADGCTITALDIREEEEKLSCCTAIFCPSPMVRDSLLAHAVPEEKLLVTSYGWDPSRFPNRCRKPAADEKEKPVFLFVGTLCVRKGVPLLLRAWQEAQIDGDLILCGAMEDEIRDAFADFMALENVRYLPYTQDIGVLYRRADIFVFPTLEEGGPMVTYEAMAHALPVLVTAMGAGAIARDRQDGFILPDCDPAAWVQALRTMAADPELRTHLGENAEKRAQEFTWERTAAGRAALLKEKFPTLWR